MPDITPPINEAPAPGQLEAVEETLETPKATVEPIGTRAPTRGPTPPHTAPAPTGTESGQAEIPLEVEIEEELIIEDFTIDGICGVY
jgi:mycofactocin precursor